jgi:hypothetical protein
MASIGDLLAQLSDGHDGLDGTKPSGPPSAPELNPGAAGEQATPESPMVQDDPPEAVQEALRELVRGYELESDAVRRFKVKTWREGEEFWRGNQNIWFSAKDSNWHTPFERGGDERDLPRYDYAINLYRPWGLSIIASLIQAPPKIQYLPVSAQSQEDVATARAATRIAEIVARNNHLSTLRVKKAYYLWTQGIFATYVRFVVDGGQFGHHEAPILEDRPVEVLPDRFECPACNAYQPARTAAGLWAGGPVACRGCGALMGPDSFHQAESVVATVATGSRPVANGAEKMDVYGPLFFKVPPQAEDQRGCYYLILAEEQHKSVLRAAYPGKADQIGSGGPGAEDAYERLVRLSLADGPGTAAPNPNLVTYKRAWLRPEAFWSHADNAMRQELLRLYPQGCRVEFAGEVFLQALPESMDDGWVICTGLPGTGIYRDPMGMDALPIQRQINDSVNIVAEHREMSSAPPILYDARYINGEALAKKRMQPASYVPIVIESVGPQKSMAEMIFQPRLGVDPQLWNDGERLAEMGQFITGALPSNFGGGIPDLKTAAAYAQSRDQAMGRLSLIWKQMRVAEAREMTLAVECFRRNRADDVELVVEGQSGGFKSEYVRLNEIRGNFIATPTADEDFPQSFTEVRASLEQLMQSKDPELLAVIGAPVNRPLVQHYLGLPELVDPGGDNRAKQFMEIEALAASEPIVMADGGMEPSILPDVHVDDHPIHIGTIKEWAVSEAGLQAKAARPQGYANVIAHLLAHQQAMAQAAPVPEGTNNN